MIHARERQRRISALLWLVALGAATAVEIATASTWWALMIVCARLAWNDLRTAAWLWRADPQAARGRACGWAFVATGIWKMTAAAVAAVPLAMITEGFRANPRLEPLLMTSAFTLIAGSVSCLAAGLMAVRRARRIGWRLWVHDSLHSARRRDEWPLTLPADPLTSNRLRIVLYSSGASVALLSVVTAMCLAPMNTVVQISGLILIWGAPIVAIIVVARYATPATAERPVDCWPDMRPAEG